MRPEPIIDYNRLRAALRAAYGIPAHNVRYFPTEWADYCYIIEDTKGPRYFLKLHPRQTIDTASAASAVDFYLPLVRALHDRGILPHVPYPLPTLTGELTAAFDAYQLILVHFIEGEVLGQKRLQTAHFLRKIARQVGTLHASTPQLQDIPNPLVERYALAFTPMLYDVLDALPTFEAQTEGQQQLRECVLPRRQQFLDFVQRAQTLQAHAQARDKRRVLCHTDLHGWNMMLDASDTLYLLDWENAILAPPEHDLFFFAGEPDFWEVFLPEYERIAGPATLDAGVFGFYYYRRTGEDITEPMIHILRGNGGDEGDAGNLDIVMGCFNGLPAIEATLAHFATHLAKKSARRHPAPGGGC